MEAEYDVAAEFRTMCALHHRSSHVLRIERYVV